MYRTLPAQAKRHGISHASVRGMTKCGLEYAQVPSGSIYISDEAMDEYFKSFTLKQEGTTIKAQRLAAKVAGSVEA